MLIQPTMLDLFSEASLWSPWLNFFSEAFCMQFAILVTLFFFFQTKGLFYSTVYTFLLFFWLGLFLAYFGAELFTGFFWVVEISVFFVFILFLFFFNFNSELCHNPQSYFGFLMAFFCFFSLFYDDYAIDYTLLNFGLVWDDFFEALSMQAMSDIYALYLSYYFFNSLLLAIFGFFIFLVSVCCILALRASKATYTSSIAHFLSIYSFFQDLLNFEFLRRQNLFLQSLRRPLSRVVSRQREEWSRRSQS